MLLRYAMLRKTLRADGGMDVDGRWSERVNELTRTALTAQWVTVVIPMYLICQSVAWFSA